VTRAPESPFLLVVIKFSGPGNPDCLLELQIRTMTVCPKFWVLPLQCLVPSHSPTMRMRQLFFFFLTVSRLERSHPLEIGFSGTGLFWETGTVHFPWVTVSELDRADRSLSP